MRTVAMWGSGIGLLAAGVAIALAALLVALDDDEPSRSVLADTVEEVRSSVVSVLVRTADDEQGQGSGFVIDDAGNIITNFHVVQGAVEVLIQIGDDEPLDAEILGTDPGNDLATLRVIDPPEELRPVRLGTVDDLRVGDSVFAIGSPFGLDLTITAGIVSGLDRDTLTSPIARPVLDGIQTDAAINPGNSGGQLFNDQGEVVGVNTALQNPTGQRVFIGVGLSIPIDTVRRFLPEMIAGGTVQHPTLGLAGVALGERFVRDAELGIDTTSGVYVTAVQPDGPANRAGVRAAVDPLTGQRRDDDGDIIVSFDGEPIETVRDLRTRIDAHAVSDTVVIGVIRDGELMTLEVRLDVWAPPNG